ncbi:hypothetical protein M422DRAFT_242643 [Sphaerobolus stellatus SS14]|nr:hypothetical protein M422DRAFT_242643 [Sphaerobolus stellatus SS14]
MMVSFRNYGGFGYRICDIIGSIGLPSFKRYHGPAHILKDRIENWNLSCISFEDGWWNSIGTPLANIPQIYMKSVTTLDLSAVYYKIEYTNLVDAARMWPNINHLRLSSTSINTQGEFKEVLHIVSPLPRLNTTLMRGYYNLLGIVPTEETKEYRSITSLQEITLDRVVKYSWDIKNGWISEDLPSSAEPDVDVLAEEKMETRMIVKEFIFENAISFPDIAGKGGITHQ